MLMKPVAVHEHLLLKQYMRSKRSLHETTIGGQWRLNL